MGELHEYLNSTKYTDPNEDIEDWHHEFLEAVRVPTSQQYVNLDDATHMWFKEESAYYTALHDWYTDGGGVRYRSRVKWNDKHCEDDAVVTPGTPNTDAVLVWDTNQCDPSQGLSASRVSATLRLEFTDKGQDRYDTMTAMREGINKVMGDSGEVGTTSSAFPYSFEFLYWEEVGIIDAELGRNLAICGAVVIVMVGLMIPHPRIAVFVMLSILLSVADLVGFMYWWGVTISGISTIYVLISVGLAVDYSAHIAHMFVESTGTAPQRSIKALTRIGPSVFNAVLSTMAAVIIIGFSKSYIFRVFFKALFLTVLIGGALGLLFLPAILSLFGGDRAVNDAAPVKTNAVADDSPRDDNGKAVEMVAQNTDEEDHKQPDVQ